MKQILKHGIHSVCHTGKQGKARQARKAGGSVVAVHTVVASSDRSSDFASAIHGYVIAYKKYYLLS